MSCENLTNVRKGCSNPIAGLKSIYMRDWESFAPLKNINTYSINGYDNQYVIGTYSNLEVYNDTQDTSTSLTADISVNDAGIVNGININNIENYYSMNNSDIFSFPSLPIDSDNGSPITIVITSLKDSKVKHTINGNNIYFIDRNVNDFGESVSTNWEQIQFAKESATFNTNTIEDLSTGNLRYEFTVECVVPNYQTVSDFNLLSVGQRPLVIFMEDFMSNGNVWFLGLDLPMQCTKIEKMSGTKFSDGNMTKLTFTGYDLHPEIYTGL